MEPDAGAQIRNLENEIRDSRAEIKVMVAESRAEFQQLRADFQEFRAALADDINQFRKEAQKQAVETERIRAEFHKELSNQLKATIGVFIAIATVSISLISLQINSLGKAIAGHGSQASAPPPVIINVPAGAAAPAQPPGRPAKP